MPDNAYGNVVEAAFKQAVGRKRRRGSSRSRNMAPIAPTPARTVAQALGQADALLLADDGESVVATADALTGAGANLRNIQLLGTGLWDNPRVFASPALQGGLYAGAGSGRLPRLRQPLPRQIWRRAGANRDACL